MWEAIDFNTIHHMISWVLIITGSFFIITSGIGIVRMPDFFTRIHAASLIDSMGAPLILLGLVNLHGFTLVSGKIALLIIFLFITGPTATHAIAKSAFSGGLKPHKDQKDENSTT